MPVEPKVKGRQGGIERSAALPGSTAAVIDSGPAAAAGTLPETAPEAPTIPG